MRNKQHIDLNKYIKIINQFDIDNSNNANTLF